MVWTMDVVLKDVMGGVKRWYGCGIKKWYGWY